MIRPNFKEIKTFQEFEQYYWYKEELSDVCKQLGIYHIGNKAELLNNVKAYYQGDKVTRSNKTNVKKQEIALSLDTKILESGFAMRNEYRDFFAKETGVKNFKYTADMAAAIKKVRLENNKKFTVKDLIDIYFGKNDYARFDTSSCQWNQFVKDFCGDIRNDQFTNKLKTAAVIWKILRESTNAKVYSYDLVESNLHRVKEYLK